MAIAALVGSGSTNGRMIKVAATATPGTLLHTAQSSATLFDKITVFATNGDTVARELTIEYGGVLSPDDQVKVTIPPKSGLTVVIPAMRLNNGLVVRAFCATAANMISCYIEVDRQS